jgi:glycogen debranching enzyme
MTRCTTGRVPGVVAVVARPNMGRPRRWIADAPAQCVELPRSTYRRNLVDLAALRFSPPIAVVEPAGCRPAWFTTMFGRDSIFTNLPSRVGGGRAGLATGRAATGDFRDEDPGRVLHEMRAGGWPR